MEFEVHKKEPAAEMQPVLWKHSDYTKAAVMMAIL